MAGRDGWNRRDFLKGCVGAAAAGALGPMANRLAHGDEVRPPNVVMILADDLGYGDIGCFGAEDIATPRIDRMAQEGMRFTDYYCCAPVCTPARAAMMTGCYARRIGLNMVLYARHEQCLNPDELTIAEVAKRSGYATAIVGKWHLGGIPPTQHGFDEWIGSTNADEKRTEICTDATIDFIGRHRDEPFFAYLAHADPHVPLKAYPPFKGKSERGLYGDVVETLDWSTGRILDALDEMGLGQDTLVVFTSDNGPWLDRLPDAGSSGPFRGGKYKAFEGGHRMPCVMRWPARIPAGTTCPEIATAMDFLPTFAGLCGVELPTDRVIDGGNILPLMEARPGATTPYEAYFYTEGANPTSLRAVRSGQWKLFGWPEADNATPDWYPVALYDLDNDPGETTDVAGDHPQVADRLRKLLDDHRAEIERNSRPPGKKPS